MTDITNTFIDQAHVTLSDKFYIEKVPANVLRKVLWDFMVAAERLDVIKKSVFYGRDLPEGFTSDVMPAIAADCIEYPIMQPEMIVVDRNVIHGIIGIATEAGELVEALNASMFEAKALDVVNVFEECSDVAWYQAILLRCAGKTFPEMFKTNIEKLRKRFGDKFTEFDALNRDLEAERTILEAGMVNEPKSLSERQQDLLDDAVVIYRLDRPPADSDAINKGE